jgi:hypothetical protein
VPASKTLETVPTLTDSSLALLRMLKRFSLMYLMN